MTRLPWSAAALVVVASISAEITPVPGSQNVDAVFGKADLVCNCVVRIIKVVDEANVERAGKPLITQHLTATVEILDLYKAESTNRHIQVEFDRELPSTSASLPELRNGERALMFLKAGLSSYVFADPFLGVIPFEDLPRHRGGAGLTKLQAALAAVLQMPNREDRVRAVQLLEGFDNLGPDATAALLPLSRSTDPELALSAFGALLKTKGADEVTLETLTRLKSYLDSYGGGSETTALVNVGSQLRSIDDPKALRAIEGLALSRFVVIRRGAMQALRAMKNPDAAPALATRLDDSDGYVRYLAVISLAETFGKYDDYAPSMYLFDRNPGFYLGLWKSWWTTEGQAYQSSPEVK